MHAWEGSPCPYSASHRPEAVRSARKRVAQSRFHVLRAQTSFMSYRGRQLPFSSFARLESFSALSRESAPVFMFCALGFIFGGTKGVGSRFHILRAQTSYRLNQGLWLPFSCFALPESFSAVPRASGPVFMFCAPGLIFGDTEGVGCRFQVLCPDSFSAIQRASGPVFKFCAHGIVFGGTEGVVSCFHVLRARTRFRRYRGRRLPFSCFARPDSFSTVPWRQHLFSCFALPD
jgi:hypothetical protein